MSNTTRNPWTKSQLKELRAASKEEGYTRVGQAELYVERSGDTRPMGGVRAKMNAIIADSKRSKTPASTEKTTQRGPQPVSNVTLTARVGELTISGPTEAVIKHLQESGNATEFTVSLS